ncbi:unnamed protein product [Mytilus edulis]|uniref:Uncharacterized protein n=1 Tax=Mytilus edulis TaxID=6550 RepID=A0A8S3STZ3_MYTED|nr:unnamed protein product [Mytilus edulis]
MTVYFYQGDPSDIAIEDATGQKINTVEGRKHTLECSVTSGQPGGNITWSTDEAVVATNRPSLVRYSLIPQRSDNGKLFKCEAFNSEGKQVLESSVQLEVFLNDGNDPDATTVWERLHKNTIIIQNDELNFKSINRTDAGIYTCRVDTKAGVNEDNATVVVQCAPYFVSSTENTQYGVYLKTAKIEIKFVSVPEYISYEVFKNGSRFTNFTEFDYRNTKLMDNIYGKNVSVKGSILSLQIQLDTPEYFTSYQIVVKNVFGSSNHAIKLVSASAPFIPKILRPSPQQTKIFVSWTPGFDGGYLQWFIVEYKEIEDLYWSNQTVNSSNSTFIGGLQPATKYLIRMFARNMIDDSNRTDEILVQTANSRADGNDLDALQNGIHTNSDIAEIPVYSSIDKRHNLRLHQTGAYTVDQKGITNPLKSVHQNRETGKEGKFGSMKCASGIEEGEQVRLYSHLM